MSSFAKISIRFNADLKQFSSQMANAQRQMSKVGKKMQSVGKNLTIGVTAPIVALGYKSVIAFDKQAKAIAQVEAGVKSTGKAAGFATEELLKMASDLQNKTIFGDEEILQGATAQLLTFTNIAGQQFERTQLAALDLATRLDGDLKSASIQLGKALNDPVANLSALSRSGIQFSKEQKAVINSLVATNRLADAQTIILDELEKQYGGAAEAAAKAGTGGLQQLSNIIGDLSEDIGEIISEALTPMIAKIKEWALSFQNLDRSTKKIIVVVSALLAAIGPVLTVLGFMMTTVIPGLVTAFGVLSAAMAATPFGLIAAAVGVAVGAMILFTEQTTKVVKSQNVLSEVSKKATDSIAKEKAEVEKLLFIARDENVSKAQRIKAIEKLNKINPKYLGDLKLETINTDKAREAIEKYNTALLQTAKAKAAQEKLQEIQKKIIDKELELSTRRKAIIDEEAEVFGKATDNAAAAAESEKRLALAKQLVELETKNGTKALKEQEKQLLEIIRLNDLAGSGGSITPKNQEGSSRSRNNTSIIAGESNTVALVGVLEGLERFIELLPGFTEKINEEFSKMELRAKDFNEKLTDIVENAAENFAIGFGELLGNFANGGLSLQNIGNLVLSTLADMAIQVGTMAIKIGVAVEGIKSALATLAGPVAIAAGIALIALGNFAKSGLSNAASGGGQSTRAFANGGIVYSPTNALIGEYAGARSNPEIVAPLDKLKNIIGETGSGNVHVTGDFKIRNRELVAQVDSARKSINRRS